MTNLDTLITEICDGKHDKHLGDLKDAIIVREKLKDDVTKKTKFLSFKRNDSVRFNDQVRPKYMEGLTGKVIDKKVSKVVVKLDPGQGDTGRFNVGLPITCPVEIIDKIE